MNVHINRSEAFGGAEEFAMIDERLRHHFIFGWLLKREKNACGSVDDVALIERERPAAGGGCDDGLGDVLHGMALALKYAQLGGRASVFLGACSG